MKVEIKEEVKGLPHNIAQLVSVGYKFNLVDALQLDKPIGSKKQLKSFEKFFRSLKDPGVCVISYDYDPEFAYKIAAGVICAI